MDFIFGTVQDAMDAKQYELVDSYLKAIDLNRISVTMMLALLCATNPWKEGGYLKMRTAFYNRVHDHIMEREGSKRANDLLEGWGAKEDV